MTTKTTSRHNARTRTVALLLGFLTAFASLGLLSSTTQAADAAPGGHYYNPQSPSAFGWYTPDYDPSWWINEAPEFNNYLTCFNGAIFVDFVDPDGPDNLMTVEMKVHRNGLTYTYTMDMSDGYHGVYWWKNMNNTHSNPPHLIESISLRAKDFRGAWSDTVTRDYDHSNWDQCPA